MDDLTDEQFHALREVYGEPAFVVGPGQDMFFVEWEGGHYAVGNLADSGECVKWLVGPKH